MVQNGVEFGDEAGTYGHGPECRPERTEHR
jgi:hypothetical protein